MRPSSQNLIISARPFTAAHVFSAGRQGHAGTSTVQERAAHISTSPSLSLNDCATGRKNVHTCQFCQISSSRASHQLILHSLKEVKPVKSSSGSNMTALYYLRGGWYSSSLLVNGDKFVMWWEIVSAGRKVPWGVSIHCELRKHGDSSPGVSNSSFLLPSTSWDTKWPSKGWKLPQCITQGC